MSVKHLDHLNLTVTNLEASLDWYRRLFGFVAVEQGKWNGQPWAIIRSGQAMLCMYENPKREFVDSEKREARAIHGVNHFSLRITDPVAWEAVAKREGIHIHYGGAYRYPHSTSWYVNDPTGYDIEVVAWDEDKVRFK